METVEDAAAGEAGTTDMGMTHALALTSGEGWESVTAAEDTLIPTADTWGATDTSPAAEGTLIPTEDTWGATPVAGGW